MDVYTFTNEQSLFLGYRSMKTCVLLSVAVLEVLALIATRSYHLCTTVAAWWDL